MEKARLNLASAPTKISTVPCRVVAQARRPYKHMIKPGRRRKRELQEETRGEIKEKWSEQKQRRKHTENDK